MSSATGGLARAAERTQLMEKATTIAPGRRTAEDRLQALFALRNVARGMDAATSTRVFHHAKRWDDFLGGDGMPQFLTQLREDALATLTDAERTVSPT